MKAIMAGALTAAVLLAGCRADTPAPRMTATPASLAMHAEEFREDVVKVADGIHVAIGFGIANSILIEGDDGLVVVDVMESLEAAERIAARFRSISDKPVVALIYTHSHPDHIHGGRAFVDPGAPVDIYAHETLMQAADKISSVLQPVITRRSLRMYGNLLADDERSNVGIGPFVDVHEHSTLEVLRPTHNFRDRLEVTIAGVPIVLQHAPGETDDQIFVWLPEQRVLLPGDNFYKAFPNLYTIRGTSYRDPKAWADSLDMMRALDAEYLVPSHGRPIHGAEEIRRHLTDYRDAIRYVHDQTIRLSNAGLTPDDIAQRMRLPPHLAESPYLQPFYGKPEWSARMVFQGQLGWFDGNPSNLHPTPPDEKAARIAALAGGKEGLERAIRNAAEAGEQQWVLELSDHMLRLEPGNSEVREARIAALRTLAAAEANPNARHYYLMRAGELAEIFAVPSRALTPSDDMLRAMPLSVFFDGMAVALDGEAAWDVHTAVAFDFPDLGERYTLTVRRGVTERVEGIDDTVDLHVRIDSLAFKRLLAGLRSPALALARDFDYVKGGRLAFARYMRLFNPDIDDSDVSP